MESLITALIKSERLASSALAQAREALSVMADEVSSMATRVRGLAIENDRLIEENKRLRAMAEFGREVLSSSGQVSRYWIIPAAVRHGLLTDRDWEETDLAQLPEKS